MKLLRATSLYKSYGSLTAVRDVSFAVSPGEIVGLLGPNGAGKSTTVGMVFGAVLPDRGTIFVGDNDLFKSPKAAKSLLGIVTQNDNLDRDFTVLENLLIFSHYHNIPRRTAMSQAMNLLAQVELEEHCNKKIDQLSGGMCRRLTLARALVGQPSILLLDEPTTGLDPEARQAFWRLIVNERAKDRAILLTTHYMEEAERLCDRLILMERGAIVDSGTPVDLIRRIAGQEVVEITGPNSEQILAQLSGCDYWLREFSDGYLIGCRPSNLPEQILETLSALHPQRISRRNANLNDVFLLLTGEELT